MRTCDLVGTRFGRLTVERKLDETKSGYRMWDCRCDCGGRITASTRDLKRGTVKDCGCMPKKTARRGSIAEDLTGQKFGKLTVLFRGPNQNGRVMWQCRCDCGKEHAASAHDLKAGKCKSCGCGCSRSGRYYVDLSGRQFGRLTALYPTEKRSGKCSVYWHCRCSCGKEVDVTEDALCHGNYKSCGCLKEEIQKKIYTQLTLVDGTCVEILEKRKFRSDNTSGFRGVSQKKNGTFRVSIGFKGKRFYLGCYPTKQEAVRARLEAEEKIHGGFIRAYHDWNKRAGEDPAWADAHPLLFEVEKVNGEIQISTNMKT